MIHPQDPSGKDTREWPTLSEHDNQIHELLDRWETARGQGRYVSAEELCSEHPELLDQVRQHIRAMEAISKYVGDPSPEIVTQPTSIDGYEVIGELGQGGISVVYLCQQEEPHRRVAVKLLQPGRENSSLRRRFKLEADILAALQHHPGIAKIYETGCADCGNGPQSYYVMEYIEGTQLDSFVSSHRGDEISTIRLFIKICDAVAFAHRHGVIHRDLKPSNILVDQYNQPKILDFGIARLVGNTVIPTSGQSTTVGFLGTPPYMSPEQFSENSKRVDTRSDVYSLGVILYQALAGRLPYDVENKSLMETAKVVESYIPLTLSRINPKCRGDLETIVSKALEKDPADRYQHVSELAADLQSFLDGDVILAKRRGQLARARQWYRHNRLAASLGGFAALALAVGFAVSLTLFLKSSHREKELGIVVDQLQQEQKVASTLLNQKRHFVYNNVLLRASDNVISNPAVALTWLDDVRTCPKDLRGLAYHLTRNRCLKPILQIEHEKDVVASAFSPDGRLVATLGRDRMLRVTSIETGKLIASQSAHVTLNCHLKFVADRRLCFSNRDIVQLIDIQAGTMKVRMTREWDYPTDYLVDANDRQFVTTSDTHLLIWDFDGPEPVGKIDLDGSTIVSIALDKPTAGQISAVTRNGRTLIYRLNDSQLVRELSASIQKVSAVGFSPDGRYIAMARETNQFVVIDSDNGELVQRVTQPGHRIDMIEFAQRAGYPTRLIISSRQVIHLWDLESGNKVSTLNWRTKELKTLSASRDGSMFVVGGVDYIARVVPVYPPTAYEKRLTNGVEISRVAFSPNGQRFAYADIGGSLYLLNRDSGETIKHTRRSPGGIMSLTYSQDGRYLGSSDRDGRVDVWDGQTGELVVQVLQDLKPVRTMRFGAGGETVITTSRQGPLQVWSITDKKLVKTLVGHEVVSTALAVSPDGSTIASGDDSGKVILWDAKTYDLLYEFPGHYQQITELCFSPDSQSFFSAGRDFMAKQWRVKDVQLMNEFQFHSNVVTSIDVSPDGRTIVTGSRDRHVVFWDVHNGDPKVVLDNHPDWIRCVRISPDSKRFASAGKDGYIVMWNTENMTRDSIIPLPSRLRSKGVPRLSPGLERSAR